MPWAEVGFGLDVPRYYEWEQKLRSVVMPVYWAIPFLKNVQDPVPAAVTLLRRIDKADISDNPSEVYSGGSSGFGALNISRLKKATVVGLFGFDYFHRSNKWHADGSNYEHQRIQSEYQWKVWAENFSNISDKLLSCGVKVFNGCEDSHIKAFPRMSPQDALIEMERYL